MHIVLVCREYVGSRRAGGIGSYMQEIGCAYVRKGHKVTVVTASDDTRCSNDMIDANGIRIISLSGGDFLVPQAEGSSKFKKLRAIYRFHSYRRQLARIIKNLTDTDIVEVADYGAEALYLLYIDKPIVIRLHTPQSLSRLNLKQVSPQWWQIYRRWPIEAERKIFNSARYISSCSKSLLDWVNNNYDISSAKTTVIENPISTEKFTFKNNATSEHEAKVIFYAGTISNTKGIGDLIKACLLLIQRGFRIHLRLAGKGGTFETSLKDKARENSWSWLEFMGKLTREEVYSNYVAADICCFPSWWENMPMVCLESMALGAVVVSTTTGGIPEIITDGHDGLLCQPRNPENLADTLEKALTLSTDQRRDISQHARITVSERFNTDIISERMLDFFNAVITDYNITKKR